MTAQYIYLIIFFCVAYLIITDQSVAKAFYILTQLAQIQYEKVKWWIIYNPANPIVRYFMWRKSMRLAKELMEELAQKDKT
jgi:hypothetical protein